MALTLTGDFPAATFGVAYNFTPVAAGGVTPYKYALVAGALPPGLRLNAVTGMVSGTPISYSSHAIATDFTRSEYWNAGVQYTPVSALPGYSFTGSGVRSFINLGGGIDEFATGVPAINDRGLHAHASMTNIMLRSQELNDAAWTKRGCSITPNAIAAPNGTLTADTITATSGTDYKDVYQAIPGGGATHAFSAFLKAGTVSWAGFSMGNGASNDGIFFNLATGVVGSKNNVTYKEAYMIPCVDGWFRCVWMVGINNSAYPSIEVHTANNQVVNWSSAGTETIHSWQAQAIPNNHPDGGPVIPTGAATALIGASVLSQTSPITTDQDFIFWAVVDHRAHVNGEFTTDVFAALGFENYLGQRNDGLLRSDVSAPIMSAASVPFGRIAIMHRRKAGVDTLAYKKPDGTVVIDAGVAQAWINKSNILRIGHDGNGRQPNCPIEDVQIKLGAFTDAEITSILTNA